MSAKPQSTLSFQPHEKVRDGFVRILRVFSSATRHLKPGKSGTGKVHEARVLIKRLRAMLWFARPTLGKIVERQAKVQLRSAARLLAGPRDLAVAQLTLAKIGLASKDPRNRTAVAHARRSLETDGQGNKTLSSELKQTGEILRSVIGKIIEHAAVKDAPWPLPSDRLDKALQAAHRAGKKAKRTKNDTDFHNWRKKAKRLLYISEMTGNAHQAISRHHLDKLQEKLGEDHDCMMADQQLRAAELPPFARRRVAKLLNRRQAHLRRKARRIARRIDW